MGVHNCTTSFDKRKEELEKQRVSNLMFSYEGIDAEIKVWESIKSCNYFKKSYLFKRKIDVDKILKELYRAKEAKKVVELKTESLFLHYMSEEERIKKKEEEELKKDFKELKIYNNIKVYSLKLKELFSSLNICFNNIIY